jgi:hypothetical protein
MSLTDIMSSMHLTLFPTIAMVLFCTAFAAIIVRTCLRGDRRDATRHSMIPLDDQHASTPSEGTR